MGNGYFCNGTFKLVVIANNNVNVYAYIAKHFVVWNNRLRHINFQRLHDMVKLNLLPYFDKCKNKCITCKLTKIIKILFPSN